MVPMIASLEELRAVRAVLEDAKREMGITDHVELGVMIETPAAALMAGELAAMVDFLSLGTNDLAQYVLAADRENESMTSVYAPLHPAMLRLVRQVLDAAGQAGKPVAVCGEAASSPAAAPLLVGMGVKELSVPCAAVCRIKRLIRRISARRERALSEELMALPTAAAVAARLDEARRATGEGCTREP
jgi:phosphocarrier protein FPr/phosphocarrier protein